MMSQGSAVSRGIFRIIQCTRVEAPRTIKQADYTASFGVQRYKVMVGP